MTVPRRLVGLFVLAGAILGLVAGLRFWDWLVSLG